MHIVRGIQIWIYIEKLASFPSFGTTWERNLLLRLCRGLTGERTVKRLRLSRALTIPESTSVYDACRRMASRRVDAVLLTDSNALLCGILTDKVSCCLSFYDITCKNRRFCDVFLHMEFASLLVS